MSKIAFLFPGQGAQKAGMGQDFYEKFPSAKEIFDQASATKDFFQLLKQVGIYGGHVAGQRLYLDYFVFVLISFYVLVCQKGFAAAPGAVYANCIYLR